MLGGQKPHNLISRKSSGTSIRSFFSGPSNDNANYNDCKGRGLGVSDYMETSSSDTNSENIREPLSERLLGHLKLDEDDDDDIFFKYRVEKDKSDVSVIGSPFSDDELVEPGDAIGIVNTLKKPAEFKRMLEEAEITQFSKEYQDTMREIHDYKFSSLSPPCSTCSLCSTCTEDTWDILKIDDGPPVRSPETLASETYAEVSELKEEHSDLLEALLSTNIRSVDDSDTDSTTEKERFQEYVDKDKVKFWFESENLEEPWRRNIKERSKYDLETRLEKPSRMKAAGISKMLSTYDWQFSVSPPDYDYFRNEKLAYAADLDDVVPWSVRERSRKKCSAWLTSSRDDKKKPL